MFFFKSTDQAIKFIIGSILPFANAKGQLEQALALSESYDQAALTFDLFWITDATRALALINRLEAVSDTHCFIIAVLAQCLADRKTLDDLIFRKKIGAFFLQNVEPRIKSNLESIDFKVLWGSKGGCSIRAEFDATDTIKTAEIVMVCSITMALCSVSLEAALSENSTQTKVLNTLRGSLKLADMLKPDILSLDATTLTYSGEGLEKIALCLNCGIFFEKKRADQEFCSTKCGTSARMRKMREKKEK